MSHEPTKHKLQTWIDTGYVTFAFEGPHGLKVERLASAVGKSKSSFYHHFADLEVYTSELLGHHLVQAAIMAEKEAACVNLEGLIEIIEEHREDLLFSRQLRIHRENQEFMDCFCRTNEMMAVSITKVWSEILDLQDNTYLAGLVLKLSMENFFLQITDETLNHAWLSDYFHQLKAVVQEFKRNAKITALDGSV